MIIVVLNKFTKAHINVDVCIIKILKLVKVYTIQLCDAVMIICHHL